MQGLYYLLSIVAVFVVLISYIRNDRRENAGLAGNEGARSHRSSGKEKSALAQALIINAVQSEARRILTLDLLRR